MMFRYALLLRWITIILCTRKSNYWNYISTPCTSIVGYSGQNISLSPVNKLSVKDDAFQWYIDKPRVTNALCIYQNNECSVQPNENAPNIKWQSVQNHTLILINLTTTYSRNYYFNSFETLGVTIAKYNTLCYNVSVHSAYQTHCCTTTLSMYSPTPVHRSYTLTSTNFTHVAVHYTAGNVEAQHDTATPHTMWIIPLVIVITIIVLICFKFPQKAWNKFTQYRYNSMLAAT